MDSKKLLVFSDSHGDVAVLRTVFKWALDHLPPNDTICAAAFCGDGLADLQPAATAAGFYCSWELISGNNDYGHSTPSSSVFEFADRRFFMCHGHKHNIYSGYDSLAAAARTNEASVVLFGHAHIPIKRTEKGILIVNPGSVGRPRSSHGATFAVLECKDDKPPEVEFFGIGAQRNIHKVNV